jgi:hypothetical protein
MTVLRAKLASSLLAARLLKHRRQLPPFRPTSVASDNTLSPEVRSRLAAFLTLKSEDDAAVYTVIPPPFMVVKIVYLGEPASLLLQHFKTSGRNFFRKG